MNAPKIRIRRLKASEVTFRVTLAPEDIEVRGNFICSGDDEADRADENAIIERLNRGETEAWCIVVVKATWEGITAYDTLGGCTFDAGAYADGDTVSSSVEECIEEHGMRQQALAHLNAEVQQYANRCVALINRLRIKPTR